VNLEPTQNNVGRFWVKLPNILAMAGKEFWSQHKIILDASGLNCPTFWLWQKKSLDPTQNNV